MRAGSVTALIVTGLIVIGSLVALGVFSFFMWALSLNGFMGQERAVNASMITFIALAAITGVVCVALSLFSVYYLSVKKMWNAAGAAVLSIVIFATVGGGLQLASVFVSVIVASQMRTTR